MSRRVFWSVLVAVAAVGCLRATTPWALEAWVNAKLAGLDNYSGRLGDVDLAFWRGVGIARDFVLERKDARAPTFIVADRIELDVRLASLFRGRPVANLDVKGVEVNFVPHPDARRRQLGQDLQWGRFLRRLPFEIERFTASEASVIIHGPELSRSVPVRDIRVDLRQLSSRPGASGDTMERTGRLDIEATLFDDAPLNASGRFVPSVSRASFEADAALDGLALTEINPWLRDAANLDFEGGTLELRAEAALEEGQLDGFTEIVIRDAEFVNRRDAESGLLDRARQRLAELAFNVLADDSDVLRKRIPLEARVEMEEDGDLKTMLIALGKGFRDALDFAMP